MKKKTNIYEKCQEIHEVKGLTVSLDLIQNHINNNKSTSPSDTSAAMYKYRTYTGVLTIGRLAASNGFLTCVHIMQEIQYASRISWNSMIRPCLKNEKYLNCYMFAKKNR